jgi:hypothetical protein
LIGSYLERCNDSKELLIDCLIPPACYPLVSIYYQAGGDNLLARGLPSISTIEVTTLVAIVYKRNLAKRVYLERFWRGTKLRSHARKKIFPKMNKIMIADIYLYLAYSMFGFIDYF